MVWIRCLAVCYSSYIALALPLRLVHAFQQALLLLIDGLKGCTAAHRVVQVDLTRLSTLRETHDSQCAGILADCSQTTLLLTKNAQEATIR